jgi:Cof subfamily protein (haloacid dehalogenase superfamily)
MKYKACVIDLDGTLLTSQKTVSARNGLAILKAYEAGMKILIATARPPRTVLQLLPEHIHRLCSFVYYNGALVVCPERDFYDHQAIESSVSREVIEYCLEKDPDVDLSIEVEDAWYSLKQYDDQVLSQVKGKPVVIPRKDIGRYSPSKMIISGNRFAEDLKRIYGSILQILVTDRGSLTQISNKRATKESGVMKLLGLYHISPEETICFGDDFNDLGLFQLCGRSVAMGNAIDEVKRIATEVTASHDNDGVALVLEKMLSQSKQGC